MLNWLKKLFSKKQEPQHEGMVVRASVIPTYKAPVRKIVKSEPSRRPTSQVVKGNNNVQSGNDIYVPLATYGGFDSFGSNCSSDSSSSSSCDSGGGGGCDGGGSSGGCD